jgi:hypothetical protein
MFSEDSLLYPRNQDRKLSQDSTVIKMIMSWELVVSKDSSTYQIAPRKFHLKKEFLSRAIFCGCYQGLEFGTGRDGVGDIAIRDGRDRNEIVFYCERH